MKHSAKVSTYKMEKIYIYCQCHFFKYPNKNTCSAPKQLNLDL
jgi:hypothetical protein